MPLPVHLIHGNNAERVNNARYELEQRFLPNGQEDGEVVDIRSGGNQALQLSRVIEEIIQELGTVSLIPDAKRMVVVHDLADFRGGRKAAAKKSSKSKGDGAIDRLEDYVRKVLPTTNNMLVFVFTEDDEKSRWVSQKTPLYQMIARVGSIQEFKEKRLDWQLEEALAGREISSCIRLLREWEDRGGNSRYRIITTLGSFLELLLQSRLRMEEQQKGNSTRNLFGEGLRPSIEQIPRFREQRFRTLAMQTPLNRIRAAMAGLNEAQKAFFPTGEELVVHDGMEILEIMLLQLLSPGQAGVSAGRPTDLT